MKGLILTEQGKPADAIKIFTGLTEDYPELPEPYNNLAVLYASQGQYDKARTALEMSIRTHPSYATAHENLGDIYAKMASPGLRQGAAARQKQHRGADQAGDDQGAVFERHARRRQAGSEQSLVHGRCGSRQDRAASGGGRRAGSAPTPSAAAPAAKPAEPAKAAVPPD